MNCDGFYYLSNEKYQNWKITSKNIRLRLKTVINNNFLLNRFEILAYTKQNGLPRPILGTVTVSITF